MPCFLSCTLAHQHAEVTAQAIPAQAAFVGQPNRQPLQNVANTLGTIIAASASRSKSATTTSATCAKHLVFWKSGCLESMRLTIARRGLTYAFLEATPFVLIRSSMTLEKIGAIGITKPECADALQVFFLVRNFRIRNWRRGGERLMK